MKIISGLLKLAPILTLSSTHAFRLISVIWLVSTLVYADTEAFSRRLLFETECKNIYDFGEWYDTDIRTPDFQSHFHNDENARPKKKRKEGGERNQGSPEGTPNIIYWRVVRYVCFVLFPTSFFQDAISKRVIGSVQNEN